MYAIEAQIAHSADRGTDVLSTQRSERPTRGKDQPETSKFERELASALEDLVHEKTVAGEDGDDPRSESKAPNSLVRERLFEALSDAIENEEGADSGKAARGKASRLRSALAEGKRGAAAAGEPENEKADAKDGLKGVGEGRKAVTSDEELELLAAVDDDADHAEGGAALVAPEAARDTAQLRGSNLPGQTADSQPEAEAAARSSERPVSIRGRSRQAEGADPGLEKGKRRKEAVEGERPRGARDAGEPRGELKIDPKGDNRADRASPRGDAKGGESKESIVELEVRDMRPGAGRSAEAEAQEVRSIRVGDGQGEQGSDVQGAQRSSTTASSGSRAVLDNLAREVRENMSGDIVRSARIILRSNDSGEVRLSLHPEELGRVRVQLQMQDNILTGRIVVDNAAVREVFEQNLPQLIRSFQDSGWETGSLDVTVSDGDGGRSDGRDEGARHSRPKSEEIIAERRYSLEERGLVDVMA